MSLFAPSTSIATPEKALPYRDKTLAPQARADDLLARMTLDEKIMQTQCMWIQKAKVFDSNGAFDAGVAKELFKNGLGELARLNENAGPNSIGHPPRRAAELYNEIQKHFVENTRLGIPVMVHEESLHGHQTRDATNFPVPIALASAFNEELVAEIYARVAAEVRARGGQHVLAPVVDVARDPRWGRTEELMGEDPYLVARLGLAQVKAYQGREGATGGYLGKRNVMATLKHLGVHGQSEGGINVGPSNVDERTAREVFLKPFKDCVRKGKAMGVMATYNELFGIPAHINAYLLQDILRKEWGFDGMVISDYFAVRDINTLHKVAPNLDEAGLQAFHAGIDLETPDPGGFANLKRFVAEGKIPMEKLDRAVTRILTAKFRLGLFDDPYVDPGEAEGLVGNAESRALAYRAAQESMVLLKNDQGLLPLDKTRIKTLALIGPNADKCLLGGYSGAPRATVSPLQAIRERYGDRIKVLYAEGTILTDKNDWFADTIRLAANPDADRKRAEAVAIAKQADAVVLFIGANESMSREGWAADHLGDLPTLDMLNGQQELVRAIVAVGKPTCAFVNSGPPLILTELAASVSAILQCWFLGQEGGYAMADALFGEISPGGKLPISFPRSTGHIPAYYNHKPSARRGYNLGFDISPLFAFGHGLGYTTFEYSPPTLSSPTMRKNGKAVVSVTVKNTGRRKGAETVQLYIRDEFASVPRPVKELKGFRKIWLEPGAVARVDFTIEPEMLSFYDARMKWVLEPGDFTLMLGTASDRTQSVNLRVTR